MPENVKALVVDDEERFRANLVKLLGLNSIDAFGVGSGEEAVAELRINPYDVVVLDMKMPGLTGKGTLKAIRDIGSQAKVIILTGHATVNDAVEMINIGAYDYLLKPCKTDKLVKMIREAHEKKRQEKAGAGSDAGK